ncbi:histidine kinase N-terminal 7TM domain-containing protein [Paenibacillus qinlingensis]|uniref:histidine kinase n=1 Tax=Paenibacillus qinlingensis TaxID=1837343 RepID=A0ABU1P7B3_9BACL|nr:histidine kinase N-terminal 7TM domain-containing protein [Paenibacillus qinlingensis]MDR6555062.1 PAS domain S-box-containing protein [Paenibacillus qinlingensis]
MNIIQWLSLLLFLAAGVMLYVAFLSYQQRHLPVARTMILIMIGAAWYASGYAFELLSRNLYEVKFSLQIEYVGIPFVTTLWLIQVIQFSGTASLYRKRLALALFIIPVAVFISHLTNEWHHLFYEQYIFNESTSFPLYKTVKGPWYQAHTLYNYFVILCGFFLFIPMYWRSSKVVRKQIIVLTMGAAVPFLFNITLWFGMDVDLTPFGFAVSGIVYVWGILRFNLLRFTPLALTQVFDTIRDGVILLDYEDQIVSYNKAAEGVLPELTLTKHYPAYVGEVLSANPELIQPILDSHQGNERFSFYRSEADGNKNKYYQCSVSFISDSGTHIGKMILFNDITELKENEARLRESAKQLLELNSFKDKMFTIVAHDVRDPIAHLVSITELLGEELAADNNEHAELFGVLQGQVQNTFYLVENLLDWYRNQQGNVVFRPLGWNLQQVVRQALLLAESKAEMKQIVLREQIDEKLTVCADKEMLDLILRNLLSNAIKFTGIGGWIEIGADQDKDRIVVTIRDNGEGMDEETVNMLRRDDTFTKVPDTEQIAGHARFGLMLTREFIAIHGGTLSFDSVPGVGTTFYFTLHSSKDGKDVIDSYWKEGDKA